MGWAARCNPRTKENLPPKERKKSYAAQRTEQRLLLTTRQLLGLDPLPKKRRK